jgi:outer membrane murein-binding lipoprotein Lpp
MPQRKLSKRMRGRVMQRRVRLIIEFAIMVFSIVIIPLFSTFVALPPTKWGSTPAYYFLGLLAPVVGFGILFLWTEAGEKTEIDELENKVNKLTDKIDALTNKMDVLINEIREDRNVRNNPNH